MIEIGLPEGPVIRSEARWITDASIASSSTRYASVQFIVNAILERYLIVIGNCNGKIEINHKRSIEPRLMISTMYQIRCTDTSFMWYLILELKNVLPNDNWNYQRHFRGSPPAIWNSSRNKNPITYWSGRHPLTFNERTVERVSVLQIREESWSTLTDVATSYPTHSSLEHTLFHG